jgi:hypothetical protein
VFARERNIRKVADLAEAAQDCQIFLGAWYQNRKKYTKLTKNVPNSYKIS